MRSSARVDKEVSRSERAEESSGEMPVVGALEVEAEGADERERERIRR